MPRLAAAAGLLLVLLLVTAPRFDQRDVGILTSWTGTEQGGNMGDAEYYVQYVEAIRGDVDGLPEAPFRYRPLVPLTAAPLPLAALSAINVVNVVALAVATLGLWRILRLLGLSEGRSDAGCLLFLVSFPTFYYGSIGYVDPLAVAITMWGVWAMLTDRRLVLAVLIAIGALTRESTIILPALAMVWLVKTGERSRRLFWSLVWVGCFVVTIVTVRVALHDSGTNVWRPSIDTVLDNVTRPRTWMSAVLTLGLPVALIIFRVPRLRRLDSEHRTLFGAGAALCIGVFAYSILAAYADGRFLWPIYAFTVPVAMLLYVGHPTPCGSDERRRDDGATGVPQ